MSIATEAIQTYEVGYSDISRQFNTIEQNLGQTAAHGHTATVSALEISMTKLFKVALYVHREADTDENGVRIKELLAQAVTAFKQVETAAEYAYDQIAGFHTQAAALKRVQVKDFEKTVNDMVNTIEQKLAEKKEMEEVLCKQIQDLQAQLNEYQRYITEFETDMKNPVFAIGVGIAEGVDWFGDRIAGLFNAKGGESPMEKLDKMRLMSAEARMNMVRTKQTLRDVEGDQENLYIVHQSMLSIKDRIPLLTSQGDQLTGVADSVLKSLVTLKATASKLVVEVKAIHDAAGFSGSSLDNKEEIGFSILNVCILALIDKNLSDEVQMIVDELVKGYEGVIMPQKVQNKLEETRNVLAPLLEAAA